MPSASWVPGLGEYLPENKYQQIGPNCSTIICRGGVYQVIGHGRIIIACRGTKDEAQSRLKEYRAREETQKWKDRLCDLLGWQPGQPVPSWRTMKNLIYERDDGTCWVCHKTIPYEYYELSHLHDRVCGGSDTPDNLVVMCKVCNRAYKSLHESPGDALLWLGLPADHMVNKLNVGGCERIPLQVSERVNDAR